jgi:hypothetical protein
MKRQRFLIGLVGLFLGSAATNALAGANGVPSTLTRLYDNVSYQSAGGNPVYGYKVELGNPGPNTQNKVTLTLTTSVIGGEQGAKAGFAFADGDSFGQFCKAKVGDTTITCSFGQMPAGRTIAPFFVYFTAPDSGTQVQLDGLTRYAEQIDGNGQGNSTTSSTFVPEGGALVSVGTPATTCTDIKSGLSRVQKNVTIGTSPDALAPGQCTRKVKTTLKIPQVILVPPAGTPANSDLFLFTSLEIVESFFGTQVGTTDYNTCANGAGFERCYESSVTIPNLNLGGPLLGTDDSNLMTVALYFPPSEVKNSFNINKLKVAYEGELIGKCQPGMPLPCVSYAEYFKNKNALKSVPKDYGGEVEVGSVLVLIKNYKNGVIRIF